MVRWWGFQSTPGIAAGRIFTNPVLIDADGGFNPRPALLPGESSGGYGQRGNADCFNPRPALLPGESLHGAGECDGLHGFNPRPALLPGESTP